MTAPADPRDGRAPAWSDGLRHELTERLGAEAEAVWMTGSVGRGEAVPGSDLESLAVVTDPGRSRGVRHAVAAADLSGAPWFAETSAASAADPRLVRTADDWRAASAGWASDPARDLGVVHLGLLADARPLVNPAGDDDPDGADPELLPRLAVDAVRAHPAVLADVLADALSTRAAVPSRLTRALRADPVVDLKAAVLTPAVKLARWAALRAGVTAAGTDERLVRAADPDVLPADTWESLREAVRAAARIRWDVRLRSGGGDAGDDGPGTDAVPLSALTSAERAALRAAAREIAGAQRTLDYLRSAGQLGGPS